MKSAVGYCFTGHTSAKPLSLDFSERTVDYVPTISATTFNNATGSIYCIVPNSMLEQWQNANIWNTAIANGVVTLVSSNS